MAAPLSAASGDERTEGSSCSASWLVAAAPDDSSGSENSSGSDSEEDGDGGSGSQGAKEMADDALTAAAMAAASAARQRAQAGSAPAQFDIGRRYIDGDGVVADNAEAVRWLRRAATQGHVGAQHNLALCLAEGRGAPQDTSDAVRWLRRAANKGHAPSAAELVKREQQLSGFLNSNVVVVAGRTARPAAELQQAALDSLVGCTLELEMRRNEGWVSLSGVVATAPAERADAQQHSRGKLLLSVPRSSGWSDQLWSTIVTDRRIRRYHVTAGPTASNTSATGWNSREGSSLSQSEHDAVEWRRASSRIPDLRGEAWCETWDSLGRSLRRDPANLASAFAQHAALNPELCEDCLARRPSYGLPDDGGRARWCRRCALAIRSVHPTLVNVRNSGRQLQTASGSGQANGSATSATSTPGGSRAAKSNPMKHRLSSVQIDHLRAVSKATRRVQFGPSSRGGKGKRRRNEGCAVCLGDTISKPMTLRCGHEFHFSCIVKWLAQRPKCPMCNGKVDLDPDKGGSEANVGDAGRVARPQQDRAPAAVVSGAPAVEKLTTGGLGVALSPIAGSVEIYSASYSRWVVADCVRPASPSPQNRNQGGGSPDRVTVEYVLAGERRKKTVRANNRSLLRPRYDAAQPVQEKQQQRQQQQQKNTNKTVAKCKVAEKNAVAARTKKYNKRRRKDFLMGAEKHHRSSTSSTT